jgi:hypothetical protein
VRRARRIASTAPPESEPEWTRSGVAFRS